MHSNLCSCPEILQYPVSQSETIQDAGSAQVWAAKWRKWNEIPFSLGQPCAASVGVCSGSSGCGQAGSVCWLNGKLALQTAKAIFLLGWILRVRICSLREKENRISLFVSSQHNVTSVIKFWFHLAEVYGIIWIFLKHLLAAPGEPLVSVLLDVSCPAWW